MRVGCVGDGTQVSSGGRHVPLPDHTITRPPTTRNGVISEPVIYIIPELSRANDGEILALFNIIEGGREGGSRQ